MSMFEESLLDFDVEWIRLKIFDKNNIAIGYHRRRNRRSIGKKRRLITVEAFVKGVGPFGNETAASLPGTERKFRKTEKKIAQWYFRELCRTFKHGILQNKHNENKPFGKWD